VFDRVSLSGSAILYTRLALISNVATLLIGAALVRGLRGLGWWVRRKASFITHNFARWASISLVPAPANLRARSKEVATLRDVLASTHISQTASSCARATELAFQQ